MMSDLIDGIIDVAIGCFVMAFLFYLFGVFL
jgi:hypothetical protein